jgi:REP element-mobilizing transposase RayT
MKNRDDKIFAPNNYYHIYNRGNGRMVIFKDDEDRKFFILRLRENLFPKPQEGSPLGGASIAAEAAHTPYLRKSLPPEAFCLICYCLMPNHLHLLIKQNGIILISKLIAKVCTGYSMYFNKKYKTVGHVFQDCFKSVLIGDDSQLLWTSAYIHNNPKTAGLVSELKDYRWSSYLDYAGLRQGNLCNKNFILDMAGGQEAYKKFVEDAFVQIKEQKDLNRLFLD